MLTSILFYFLSTILVLSAVMVVSARNPVHSVLFLILCFFNAAGLFLLMGAEFLAFILLIVYVGAVAVLFLFVVMMLDINFDALRRGFRRYVPMAATVAAVMISQFVMILGVWQTDPKAISVVGDAAHAVDNTRALGRVLYTDYFYPFQVSGLILLVAMMGAIVLTLRDRKDARHQNVGRQLDLPASEVVEVRKIQTGQGVDI